jgi:hypothetical protein
LESQLKSASETHEKLIEELVDKDFKLQSTLEQLKKAKQNQSDQKLQVIDCIYFKHFLLFFSIFV